MLTSSSQNNPGWGVPPLKPKQPQIAGVTPAAPTMAGPTPAPKPMVNPTAMPGQVTAMPMPGGIKPIGPGMMPQAPTATALPGGPRMANGTFNDLRPTTIGTPSLGGGGVGAPKPGAPIAAQNAQPTLNALQQALQGSTSPMAEQLRKMGMTSLQGLSGAPNRGDLASQAFQLMNEQSAPQFQQDIRKVGQAAAAFGRTGSGMTTNDLTDLASQRHLQQQQAAKGLSLDAAGLEMSDRLGIFDRTAGYGSQIGNQDLDRSKFGQSVANNKFDIGSIVRDQNVGERDYQSSEGWKRADLGLANQSRNDTNAWRGTDLQMQQQGRQDSQAQQAIENEKMRVLLEEQLLQGQFGRQYDTANLAGQYGYRNDPYGIQLEGAGQQQQNAAGQSGAVAEQAYQEALRRALESAGGGVRPPQRGNTTQSGY